MLETIVAKRREDARESERVIPLEELKRRISGAPRRSLRSALAAGTGTCIIAEMKRASPSAGVLREIDPAGLARRYEDAGACALSVLTEPHWFHGSGTDLVAARAAVKVPVLRKDFVVTPYQVYETAAMGADVVLLIVAALRPDALPGLYETAVACGLEVLVEAHTAQELELAATLPDAILGVNSRDLKTLKTDVGAAMDLAALIPSGRLAIAESGIKTRREVESLEAAGYRGFLVGETLLRADAPGDKLRELRGVPA